MCTVLRLLFVISPKWKPKYSSVIVWINYSVVFTKRALYNDENDSMTDTPHNYNEAFVKYQVK